MNSDTPDGFQTYVRPSHMTAFNQCNEFWIK